MSRRRNLMISLLSAIVACVLVYGVYVLQLKQVELQKTVNVVVPIDFIDAGTMISKEHLELKPIFAAAFDNRMFTDVQDVIGQETLIALGKSEPIMDWKLNKFHLFPNQNQSTFQIPKDYILSISNGIRAGDKVRIYISSLQDGIASKRLFPDEIIVASVKSAGNIEVENLQHSNLLSKVHNDEEKMYASRREANAAIDQINLNLTEDQWLTIDRLCREGTVKLVIAFSSAFPIDSSEISME